MISAYVAPRMDQYLRHLDENLAPARALVMDSGGGAMPSSVRAISFAGSFFKTSSKIEQACFSSSLCKQR